MADNIKDFIIVVINNGDTSSVNASEITLPSPIGRPSYLFTNNVETEYYNYLSVITDKIKELEEVWGDKVLETEYEEIKTCLEDKILSINNDVISELQLLSDDEKVKALGAPKDNILDISRHYYILRFLFVYILGYVLDLYTYVYIIYIYINC